MQKWGTLECKRVESGFFFSRVLGQRLSPGRERAFLLLVLTAFWVLGFSSIKDKSVTFDEFAHVPAGLSYLRTADFRLEAYNSPLIRTIVAIPLLMSKAKLPLEAGWRQKNIWAFAYDFMYANAEDYHRLFLRSRTMVMFLGSLTIFFIWRWARELYGPASGLGAAVIAAFDPNFMAHSQLATADVGCALFFMLAVYSFKAFYQRPSFWRAAAAGIILGLSLLTKFSLLPLLILLPFFVIFRPFGSPHPISWNRLLLMIGFIYMVAWILICSFFRWRGVGIGLEAYGPLFQSYALQRLAAKLPNVPILLPAEIILGMDLMKSYNEGGGIGYFLGAYRHGWQPFYFLVGLAVKTPVTTIILIGCGLGSMVARKTRLQQSEVYIVMAPLFFILSIVFSVRLYIGVRYFLPAMPFLFIIASRTLSLRLDSRPASRVFWGALAAGAVVSNLLIYPDYLTYFNMAAGGAGEGYKIMADSNLDWGQDLIGLKEYMKEKDLPHICLAYSGKVDPVIYHISSEFPNEPEKCEVLAVSVNFLLDIHVAIVQNHQRINFPDGYFTRFLARQPQAIIGNTIWIFRPQVLD